MSKSTSLTKKNMCIRLSDEVKEQLAFLAEREGRTMSQIIEALILMETKHVKAVGHGGETAKAIFEMRAAIMDEVAGVKKNMLALYQEMKKGLDGDSVLINSQISSLLLEEFLKKAAEGKTIKEVWPLVAEEVNNIKARKGRR